MYTKYLQNMNLSACHIIMYLNLYNIKKASMCLFIFYKPVSFIMSLWHSEKIVQSAWYCVFNDSSVL